MKSRKDPDYHSGHHCRYLLQYHIIWCPKFRFHVLNGSREHLLKTALEECCRLDGLHIHAMEVMPDHVHIFLSAPPTAAPADIVRKLKGRTAHILLQHDQNLRQFYSRSGGLWGRGYYIATIGNASAAAVEHYIREQKNHHGK